MRGSTLLAVTSLFAAVAVAQAQHDWRVIFSTPKTVFFCDLTTVRKLDNGHVQAWTKGLPAQAVSNDKITDAEAAAAAERIHDGYKPMFQPDHKLTRDDIAGLTIMDQIANSGRVSPTIRVLFELDCGEQLVRELSSQRWKGGQLEAKERPSQWRHIAPETNGESLMLALCPK